MILYGKPVAEKIYLDLKEEIAKRNLRPSLAVILVGENLASLSYIEAKEKIARKLGVDFRLHRFPEIAREDEIIKLINTLNKNIYIHGIVVQLPLPEKMDTMAIINKIVPEKDVDGFLGIYSTPAAAAILEIFGYYNISLQSKKVVIVGRGKLVGLPLEKILREEKIDVIVYDRQTENIAERLKAADIIISATGQAGLINSQMIKKDAIVIDAGIAESSGKITGDIDKSVYEIASAYSPVPGGVGPVTVACLMKNLISATKNQ